MIGTPMGFTISSPGFGFVPVKIQTQEPELVYKITNLINHKIYVGSSVNLRIRKDGHFLKYIYLHKYIWNPYP